MPSAVQPVSPADLAAWPTKRLLALRDRLLRCEANIEHSDLQGGEALVRTDPSAIRFKDDPRWEELHAAVIRILNTREHVPAGDERSALRKARAKGARGHSRSVPSKPKRG
jgi:hypothetical protein